MNFLPDDFIEDILKFKGFWKASFTDKLKWMFIFFPFFATIVTYYSINTFIYTIISFFRRK